MEEITVEFVQREVERIGSAAGDFEVAHVMEDDLRAAVLRAIAGGADNAQELAAEALKSDTIDFVRHCA